MHLLLSLSDCPARLIWNVNGVVCIMHLCLRCFLSQKRWIYHGFYMDIQQVFKVLKVIVR